MWSKQLCLGDLLQVTDFWLEGGIPPLSWFCRVDVEAWGSLAESASQQLGKGSRVAVQGRLKQEKWAEATGQTRSRLKVVANTINRVRPYGGPRLNDTSYGNQAYAEPSTSAPGIDQTFQDQSYQHMDQEYMPPPQQQYSQPQPAQSFNPNDEKWRVFFQDRSRWWDNRQNKRNPRAPDFKHKDTGDGIWLSSAPQWAQDEVDAPDLGGPAF
ncbi:hypothetical protein WJX84_009182 [Apatococcus fuscideae]|uniref:Single-stranded DNA-binding protein n=1 Tax=Apatococcus fuscideae TaxID=2026836 RepID=A0AAW1SXY1_9CHLO